MITTIKNNIEFVFNFWSSLSLDPPKAKIVIPYKSSVQTSRLGDSISFTCNVSGIPVPTITWMKQNGSGLSEVAADNVKVIPGSGSSQLIIEDIAVGDEGYYICNASSYEFHLDKVFLGVICKFFLHWFMLKLKTI